MLPIRHFSKAEEVKINDHSINLEDSGHNEQRFFFGLCPISLKTSSTQDVESTSLSELKVIENNLTAINFKVIHIGCCFMKVNTFVLEICLEVIKTR